jgi:hypothetical protein
LPAVASPFGLVPATHVIALDGTHPPAELEAVATVCQAPEPRL